MIQYKNIEDLLDALDAEEKQKSKLHRAQYASKLSAHPNCQDPDHPGCEVCAAEVDALTDVGHNEEESE